jgi:hypothetical protein
MPNPAEGTRAEMRGFQPIELADRLAVAYLALPVLIFFVAWFSLSVGALLALLFLVGVSPVFAVRRAGLRFDASPSMVLVCCAVALAWTALGGAGHFVYANADWLTRDAVLRDLVVTAWPPTYGTVGGVEVILRTPVAYYLPAASLGKVFGLEAADFLLFLWTALGVALFFLIALSGARTSRHVVIAIAVVIFFSGMDVFGVERYFLERPGLTEHLEWWARMFQYSSNTTQLFWVPNHALPGWILAALIYKHWRNPEFLKIAPIAMAVTALWSPLVTIGLAPFAVLIAAHHLRQNTWRAAVLPWASLGALTTFAAIGCYLVLDSAGIRSGSTLGVVKSFDGFMMLYVKFVLLEFGLLAFAIWLIRRDLLIAAAVAVLLALPFYMFGPGNDLVMRGSIPALMILCLAAVDALVQVKWSEQTKLVMPLLVCLSFGSITAVHEVARALLFSRWSPALQRNLVEASRGTPAHYVARLSPLLARVMRPPQPVPGWRLAMPGSPFTSHRNPPTQMKGN